MPRRHYGIELTKSQAERHFDKVVWKTFKTRVHVLGSGPFPVCIQLGGSASDIHTLRSGMMGRMVRGGGCSQLTRRNDIEIPIVTRFENR